MKDLEIVCNRQKAWNIVILSVFSGKSGKILFQSGENTVSYAAAYCIKHQIVDIKDPIGGRVDTIERT